jgi:hypothetical protein
MKIKVRASFGEHERSFEISCGSGDNKTFKWLGNVVSQRFSQCAPNGGLRHRDHFRGVTDSAQHTCAEIRFSDGQMPHPTAIISDFLRDGDEVSATLVTTLGLEKETGYARTSKWATEAFSNGTAPLPKEDTSGFDIDGEPDSATLVAVRSKASFMRMMLRSQMVDHSLIENNVNNHFSVVVNAMPRLREEYREQFRSIFKAHYLPLQEVYSFFAPDSLMTKDNFIQFTQECQLFARDSALLSARIHTRTCAALGRDGPGMLGGTNNSYSLGGFMVSLILAAQLRHNDTFECESTASESACAALQEIIDRNVISFAEEHFFPSVSRLVFCSDEVLYGIRLLHNDLFTVFEKYAQKSNTLPTSLKIEHLTECLQVAGFTDMKKDRALELFKQSRETCTCIYGRNNNPIPTLLEPPKFLDEPIPEAEIIYPEFVECIARAGYQRFFNNPSLGIKAETGQMMTLAECMLRGIKMVVNILNPPVQQTPTNPGRK